MELTPFQSRGTGIPEEWKWASPRYTVYSMNIAHRSHSSWKVWKVPVFYFETFSERYVIYMNCRILISTIILSCFTPQRYWFYKIYHHFQCLSIGGFCKPLFMFFVNQRTSAFYNSKRKVFDPVPFYYTSLRYNFFLISEYQTGYFLTPCSGYKGISANPVAKLLSEKSSSFPAGERIYSLKICLRRI